MDQNHRSEEHTSELQSLTNLVFRLLLEKKKSVLDQAIASVRAVLASGDLLVSVGDAMTATADNGSAALHGGESPAGSVFFFNCSGAPQDLLSFLTRHHST